MKNSIKAFWAKKWLRWTFIIIVICLFGWLLFGRSTPVTYDTTPVARGSVVESVTATGQIKPKSYASLRFKTTGSIAKMYVDVGDKVTTGQTIAVLDTSELSKKVTQAEADKIAADVALANAKQEVADQRVKGDQAVKVLYTSIPNSFNDILNLTQQEYASFATFYDSTGRLTSAVANPILISQRVIDASNARAIAENAMSLIHATLEDFPSPASQEQIDAALSAIHAPLQALQASLNALINAVASIPTGAVAATTLDGYKTVLAEARANLNSAIAKESSAASDARDTSVQNALTLNSREASERSAEAALEKAKATLAVAQQNLSDAYLRAPIDGTIAVKSKQIGELVTSADQVYYMLGSGPLEVVSNVPEVDVSRIKVGGDADGTLDAFSADEKVSLTVESIDPDQTTIDGVVYYKTHFLFKAVDPRFKSGMSVNLTMIANKKDDVLTIPRRAVTQKAGVSTVRIAPAVAGADPEVREVKVGLKGDLQVEIISGLSEGEKVIIGEKKA